MNVEGGRIGNRVNVAKSMAKSTVSPSDSVTLDQFQIALKKVSQLAPELFFLNVDRGLRHFMSRHNDTVAMVYVCAVCAICALHFPMPSISRQEPFARFVNAHLLDLDLIDRVSEEELMTLVEGLLLTLIYNCGAQRDNNDRVVLLMTGVATNLLMEKVSSRVSLTSVSSTTLSQTHQELIQRLFWTAFAIECTTNTRRTAFTSDLYLKLVLPCDDNMSHDTNLTLSDLRDTESAHCWFIKNCEIFAQLTMWMSCGSRVSELHPPWHSDSTYFKLQKQLHAVRSYLATRQQRTPHLQILYHLCVILLERTYFPFLAHTVATQYEGPVEPPLLPHPPPAPHTHFWQNSARNLFQSSELIGDLVRQVPLDDPMMQSHYVLFGLFSLLCSFVYFDNFPQMMCGWHTRGECGERRRHFEAFFGGEGGSPLRKRYHVVLRKISELLETVVRHKDDAMLADLGRKDFKNLENTIILPMNKSFHMVGKEVDGGNEKIGKGGAPQRGSAGGDAELAGLSPMFESIDDFLLFFQSNDVVERR